MGAPSEQWSGERGRLLFVAISALTAIALSYEYVAATESGPGFLAIVGAGVLLTALVAVPVLLSGSAQESH